MKRNIIKNDSKYKINAIQLTYQNIFLIFKNIFKFQAFFKNPKFPLPSLSGELSEAISRPKGERLRLPVADRDEVIIWVMNYPIIIKSLFPNIN